MGLPAKAPAYAKRAPVGTSGASSKARITTKEGHWSGAKEGGARGDSFLANAGSTLGVLALIATTPFIAVIVCVPLPSRLGRVSLARRRAAAWTSTPASPPTRRSHRHPSNRL